jgi:hypothetical protein
MSRLEYRPREEYLGTGLVSAYTFDFKITDKSHLLVKCYDTDDEEVFSVRGDDLVELLSVTFDENGGVVNLPAVLTTGYLLVLLLADDAPIQPYSWRGKGDWSLPEMGRALDFLSGQIQRLAYLASRSFVMSDVVLNDELVDVIMPLPVADSIMVWDATLNQIVWVNRSAFKGDTGDNGIAATIQVGTVTTVAYGQPATVVNVGDPLDAEFDFGLPQGEPGVDSAVTIGTVTTLAPGAQATVVNVGTPQNVILDIGIPEGEQGASSYTVFAEDADPTGADGVDLDLWFNNISGDYFQKESGVWVLQGNIKGPAGDGVEAEADYVIADNQAAWTDINSSDAAMNPAYGSETWQYTIYRSNGVTELRESGILESGLYNVGNTWDYVKHVRLSNAEFGALGIEDALRVDPNSGAIQYKSDLYAAGTITLRRINNFIKEV